MLDASFLAVFLTGLFGGVHCAGMCGGIVSALGHFRPKKPTVTLPPVMQTQALEFVPQARIASAQPALSAAVDTLSLVLLYNTGRISMYTLLGALAGGIGSLGWLVQTALPVQQIAFAVTNILLILMGLYVLGVRRISRPIEALAQRPWQYIRPHATRLLSGRGPHHTLLAGALWGMVPCGMVYGVLMAALVSGSAMRGAGLMLAFGLGTLPNLMLLGLSGGWFARASKRPAVRKVAGSLIIAFGLLGLWRLNAMGSVPLLNDMCTVPFFP
ncbi:MAG: sulfite exporter TauE/SafE family protein [Granulosicoccus sp.]